VSDTPTSLRSRSRVMFSAAAWIAVAAMTTAQAGEAKVAVAANFTDAAKEIGALFTETTGNRVVFSFGSTGQLFAQISQGAPFEAFLAADQARPEKAVDEGFAVPGSRFTYATGRIVLFSEDKASIEGATTLRDGAFDKIAVANPVTAPYGAAAVEAMKALGVYDALRPKIVRGNNIAQAYQFVETGNAEVGFVALSQVIGRDEGSWWLVPDDLYEPIAQDAVLLKPGADSEAARAFLAFLKGPQARAIEKKFGYGAGD
jgi:molybdate transport system substrate-binding protein